MVVPTEPLAPGTPPEPGPCTGPTGGAVLCGERDKAPPGVWAAELGHHYNWGLRWTRWARAEVGGRKRERRAAGRYCEAFEFLLKLTLKELRVGITTVKINRDNLRTHT